jgi:hypothetical protein
LGANSGQFWQGPAIKGRIGGNAPLKTSKGEEFVGSKAPVEKETGEEILQRTIKFENNTRAKVIAEREGLT